LGGFGLGSVGLALLRLHDLDLIVQAQQSGEVGEE